MDLQRLFTLTDRVPDEEAVQMILGNRIDMGSADGGLISVAQFTILAQDLIAWRDRSIARRAIPQDVSRDEDGTA